MKMLKHSKKKMRKVLFICFAFLFIIFSKSNVLALDLTTSIGCRAVYIGSYDDVYVLNTKENVTGDVLSIDGRPVGSCYAEFVLSKKSAGIQSFRYESNYNPLADLDEAKRVSPFDERGKKNGKSNLEEKKASIQRLSSDIAPIATLPELVISFREDSFHSMIHIESSQSVQYIPYDNSTSTLTLNPKTD